MNLRQRLLGAIRGEEVDRVPLILDGFTFTTREEILKIKNPFSREIAERAFHSTAGFIDFPSYVNRYLVTPPQLIREVDRREQNGKEIFTTEIQTPKGTLTAITERNPISYTTWTIKYPVESLGDIEKICSVRWELPAPLTVPDTSRIPPGVCERTVTRTAISSPFVCVAGMMPYEYFLELCATELELIKELTELCKKRILEVLDVLLSKRNIDYVWIGGSEWLTPPMGSPTLYKELVQEQERELIAHIHEAGAVAHIHCHGNVRSTFELVIERGADFFEPVEPPPDGDITFVEAKKIANRRITLGGNIEARMLECGTPDEVEDAVVNAFEGEKSRMVLKPTASPVQEITPEIRDNFLKLIECWEALSFY